MSCRREKSGAPKKVSGRRGNRPLGAWGGDGAVKLGFAPPALGSLRAVPESTLIVPVTRGGSYSSLGLIMAGTKVPATAFASHSPYAGNRHKIPAGVGFAR